MRTLCTTLQLCKINIFIILYSGYSLGSYDDNIISREAERTYLQNIFIIGGVKTVLYYNIIDEINFVVTP